MRCNKGFAFALAFSMALGYSSSLLAQEDDGLNVFDEKKTTESAAKAPAAEAANDELDKLLDEAAPAPAAPAAAAEAPAAPAAEAPAAAEDAAPAPAPAVAETAPAPAAAPAADKAMTEAEALLAEISAAEELRRASLDAQAKEEVEAADLAFSKRDWDEAFRMYDLASKHLNDRPATAELREKCRDRKAEAKYQSGRRAMLEGNREEAIKNFEDAQKLHHEQARRDLAALKAETAQEAEKDVSGIVHRMNDKDYKGTRDVYRKRLRKARQYYTTAEYDKAYEECELVLRGQPQNTEAIRLRELISQRVNRIERREILVTREEMMHQVNQAWRPVYAPDSAQLSPVDGGTTATPVPPENMSQEQSIEKRMKAMKLPSVSFRPPATLVDAVEYFRQASKDFDLPEVPAEDRGINIVLRLNSTLTGGAQANADEGDAFSSSASSDDAAASASGPVPQIPAITASNISLWQALDQVCQVTGYKFQISGPFVVVMPKDATIDDFITRSYNVLDLFVDRVSNAATDIRESKGSRFGGGNTLEASDSGSQERDWKQFFAEMGVAWPPNSSISYIKTIGKLRVTNTADNLAVFEQALNDLNVTPTLVEIETRFVEVSQEDLNSLGFEWLLNSDYSLNIGNKLGRILGIKPGVFNNVTSGGTTTTTTTSGDTTTVYEGGVAVSQTVNSGSTTTTTSGGTTSSRWQRMPYRSTVTKSIGDTTYTTRVRNRRNLGLNAFGGTSDYQNGSRYLSTVGNPISGAGESTNDQFMRINGFLGNADLSLILHMLSQRTDTDLLSAPKVVTKSGQQAVIKVVTEYIYPQDYDVTIESSSSGSSGWGGSSGGGGQILAMVEPQNFTMREVGVILDVTPEVTAEGSMINLELKPQVVDEPVWHDYGMMVPNTSKSSSVFDQLNLDMQLQNLQDLAGLSDLLGAQKEQEYYKVPMEQPFFHVRSIDTHLSIYNGATVVMGGLITEERKAMDDKVPFLGDIPFIGRLFRSRSEWSNKRNLLIFVTARLVDPRGRKVNIGSGDDVKAASNAPVPVTPAPPAAEE